ncbi:unnamed protein product, partial [Polarella glacialis]
MDMYRKVAGVQYQPDGETAVSEGSEVQKVPDFVPDPKEIAKILGVSAEEAQVLRDDKDALLRKLRQRIDEINEEEDEEEAMMESVGGV